MKHSKSIIRILLFITIQILQFCQAQTCFNSNFTMTDKYSGFSGFIYQNENQLELVNMHDYLLRYAVGLDVAAKHSYFNGIVDPNFEIDVSNDGSDNTGTLFGQSINVSNFTLASSGAFYAKVTGYHTFKISADDAAMVTLLPSYDIFCCKYTTDPGDDPLAWFLGIYEEYFTIIEYTGFPDDVSEVTLYLTAGEPLLMYMSYVNRAGSGRFNLTVTDPDNVSFTDLSDYVFEDIYSIISCNDEVDILEPASVLSSTTYSTDIVTTTMNVIGYPAYATTYYVKVPMSTIESSVISESSAGVYSSSIKSSESSNNVVSSATESSDASTSVVESSTFSYEVSSTPVSSSMASSDSLSSTIQNSATDSDITSGAASSSSGSTNSLSSLTESSSGSTNSLSSLTESSMHSSDIPYSSTKSVVAHSSVASGSISDSLSTSDMASMTSEDSSQSSILSIESSSSIAYTYTNSSSTGSVTTTSSSNIAESSVIVHTSTTETTKNTSTTVTIPCTLEECQVTSKPSTDYISDTFVVTSTVTTICPVSESGSMNFVTSTYVTKITTVVQRTHCSGGCTEAKPEYVHSANTEVSLVQETSNAQGTSHAHGTSSSSYIVELNENGVTKSSFGVVTLLISIMSLFTFI